MTSPLPGDLAREQRGVARGALAAAIVAILTLALAWWSAGRWIAPRADIADRLALALRLDLAVVFCLVAAIGRVANQRFFSAEDIGGAGSSTESTAVHESRAILQNTLEQVVLAILVHLALALLLPADRMAVIAALVLLFVVGRIAFTAGYPRGGHGRAFGFGLTFYPSVAALLAATGLALAG